jgi:hypothetical protein
VLGTLRWSARQGDPALAVLRAGRALLAPDWPCAPVWGRLQKDGVGWLCFSEEEVAEFSAEMMLRPE